MKLNIKNKCNNMDGIEVTLNDILKAGWIKESENKFTKSTTYVSNGREKCLGVTFYEGHKFGTVYRND